ncbi:MAG: type II secretion system protein [Phycisphaerae bacterium]|nr:type II secretion system protein [Phycisphaerae bacterium]
MIKKRAFTLIELLVVVAIIAILVSILLPALSHGRSMAAKASCAANLQTIIKAMQFYAEDHYDLYPLAWNMQTWEQTDGPGLYEKAGWMRRLFTYIYNPRPGLYEDNEAREVYKCPGFYARDHDPFNYFLGARAAHTQRVRELPASKRCAPYWWVPVKRSYIVYPSAFIMGGDCNRQFDLQDCDRDDYTQECLAWEGNGGNPFWDPFHNGGLNVMFADSHVNWFTRFEPNQMTYSYEDYTTWEGAAYGTTGVASAD